MWLVKITFIDLGHADLNALFDYLGDLIIAYEQFESSLAQQMLLMINEWQNRTNK